MQVEMAGLSREKDNQLEDKVTRSMQKEMAKLSEKDDQLEDKVKLKRSQFMM